MPIKASQQVLRTVRIKATVMNGDGTPHEETLNIKHKPVTAQWLERWDRIAERESRELADELQKLAKQAEEAEKEAEKAQAEGREPTVTFDLEEAQRSVRDKQNKNLLVRHLACDSEDPGGLLVDIDHIDDEGNSIAPTIAFLHTRDLALLQEIKEEIQKKAFPQLRL